MAVIDDTIVWIAEEDEFEDGFDQVVFADPNGSSSLRQSSQYNPRNLPCPTCLEPNRLTPADRSLGYQCDDCVCRTH